MNSGYKARRAAKHAAEKADRVPRSPEGLIDLMPKVPRLSWLGGKSFHQSGQQRKGRSGHATEWAEALIENGSRDFALEVNRALSRAPEKN